MKTLQAVGQALRPPPKDRARTASMQLLLCEVALISVLAATFVFPHYLTGWGWALLVPLALLVLTLLSLGGRQPGRRRRFQMLAVIVLMMLNVLGLVGNGVIRWHHEAPARAAARTEQAHRAAIRGHENLVRADAEQQLAAQGLRLENPTTRDRAVNLDSGLTSGTAWVRTDIQGYWIYAQLTIRLVHDRWVAGCPDMAGHSVGLTDHANYVAKRLTLTGKCPLAVELSALSGSPAPAG